MTLFQNYCVKNSLLTIRQCLIYFLHFIYFASRFSYNSSIRNFSYIILLISLIVKEKGNIYKMELVIREFEITLQHIEHLL